MRGSRHYMPGWLIFLGFCFGFWPGIVLLVIRILQSAADDNAARKVQEQRERDQRRTYQPPRGTMHTVDYQPVRENEARTYQPPKDATQARGQQNAAPRQNIHQNVPPSQSVQSGLTRRQRQLISGKSGKGLWIAGLITLGAGIFSALMVLLGGFASMTSFFEILMASGITAASVCLPGAVLTVVGNKNRNRAARCRNYLALASTRKKIDLDELAASIPTGRDQVRKDLQWMLDEGFFPGFYLDGTNCCLMHPDARVSAPQEKPAQDAPQEKPNENGRRVYPDERRIRNINDRIDDEYISEKMDRLEELTHNIFAYVEDHPEKENDLRQFKAHYLPTTLKILESYARFEKQGVDGENITSAMQDVKSIMDKLVSGFEKQLDALYAAEALDVSTDISVLENMMTMEGLGPLSPFDTRRGPSSKEEVK